ncbi:uncharacterized protein LOC113377128 [Ctenocephalides felis]|uniref:uncharacterized protein LOC113377128 n=1 Tax=Ctenocephalides felis TaxID=7515 RepID=UPI000E6E1B98|nr:uncharacterized protein LOC113377128 [Ctenocephalides felis]
MKNKLIIAFTFFICISSEQIKADPVANNSSTDPREVRRCADRGTPGLICTTCMNVAKCVKSGKNWLTIPVDVCRGRETCNVKEGGCSAKPGPCSNIQDQIRCRTEGLVPDAYDCQKYHFCPGPGEESNTVECKGNFAFNIKTGRCDLNANDATICKMLPIKCNKPGHGAAWPDDKNLFYVCTKDGPEFYRCDHGFSYDNQKQDCVKNQGGGGQGTGTVPAICTELGKYPDPEDEDSFYHCVKIGQRPRHKTCDWGETFDPKKLKCVCNSYWCW